MNTISDVVDYVNVLRNTITKAVEIDKNKDLEIDSLKKESTQKQQIINGLQAEIETLKKSKEKKD